MTDSHEPYEPEAAATLPTEPLPTAPALSRTAPLPTVPLPVAPARSRTPLILVGIVALLAGTVIGVGGYALLGGGGQPSGAAPSASAASSAAPRYRPVKDLCEYVDASALGNTRHAARDGKADPEHCLLGFSKGPRRMAELDFTAGLLSVTAMTLDTGSAAHQAYATLRDGAPEPTAVDGLGDEAHSYASRERLEVSDFVPPGAGAVTVSTTTLVVRHDNLVLELLFKIAATGGKDPERKALEKVARRTLTKLAAA